MLWIFDDEAMKQLLMVPFCFHRLIYATDRDVATTMGRRRNTRKYFREEAKNIINSIDRSNPLTFLIF